MLFNNDGNVLDSKLVSFKTMEGCIYCPDGVCECEVSDHETYLLEVTNKINLLLQSNLSTKPTAILLKHTPSRSL